VKNLYRFCFYVAIALLLAVGQPLSASRLDPMAVNSPHPEITSSEIANQVTVRVLGENLSGSGVIIAKKAETYTVLTNRHVVDTSGEHKKCLESKNIEYYILTTDEQKHSAKWLCQVNFADLDLALVEFSSPNSYRVVQWGNSESLQPGDRLYAAGFPNWRLVNPERIENTRELGWQAFKLTAGEVKMKLSLSLASGYQLGYTNDIDQGMSGGPILNQYGQLVGINGRLKYPLQGISVFKLADGTLPSIEQFRQMEALSWGIPTATVQKYLP